MLRDFIYELIESKRSSKRLIKNLENQNFKIGQKIKLFCFKPNLNQSKVENIASFVERNYQHTNILSNLPLLIVITWSKEIEEEFELELSQKQLTAFYIKESSTWTPAYYKGPFLSPFLEQVDWNDIILRLYK